MAAGRTTVSTGWVCHGRCSLRATMGGNEGDVTDGLHVGGPRDPVTLAVACLRLRDQGTKPPILNLRHARLLTSVLWVVCVTYTSQREMPSSPFPGKKYVRL